MTPQIFAYVAIGIVAGVAAFAVAFSVLAHLRNMRATLLSDVADRTARHAVVDDPRLQPRATRRAWRRRSGGSR